MRIAFSERRKVRRLLTRTGFCVAFIAATLPACDHETPPAAQRTSRSRAPGAVCDQTGNSPSTPATGQGGNGSRVHVSLALAEAAPSYEGRIKEILERSCLSCHGDDGQPPNLKDEGEVRESQVRIASEIARQSMPLQADLAADERQAVAIWKRLSFPKTDAEAAAALLATKEVDDGSDDDRDAPKVTHDASSATGPKAIASPKPSSLSLPSQEPKDAPSAEARSDSGTDGDCGVDDDASRGPAKSPPEKSK